MAATALFHKDPNELLLSQYMMQRKRFYTTEGWQKLINSLKSTSTVYVGNLSFYTSEEQIYEVFSRCGHVSRVIMGLNKQSSTPCGFCFVEYTTHDAADAAKHFISGTKLDERVIRADLDPGFEEGRQFGRSHRSGGQIRDDYRVDYDPGRGGWTNKKSEGVEEDQTGDEPARKKQKRKDDDDEGDDKNDKDDGGEQNGKAEPTTSEQDDKEQKKSDENPRFRADNSDED